MLSDISLVVTDLDGTLWGGSGTTMHSGESGVFLHPRAIEAIALVQANGIDVIAATGRRPRSAHDVFDQTGIDLAGVFLDGTVGQHAGDRRRFHRCAFEPAVMRRALDLLLAAGVRPCVFVDDPHVDVVLDPNPSTSEGHVAFLQRWARVAGLEAEITESVLALTVIGGDGHVLAAAAAEIESSGLASVTVSADAAYGGHSLAVTPHGAGKWAGVLAYCAERSIDPEAVLAVGDAANDVGMLTAAAVAVAPVGASPEVLALADHVIGPPGEGGWADLVSLLGLRR